MGVINTLVGLSIMYTLLNAFGLSYWVSTFAGNMIGAGVSYILNRTFTFQSRAAVPGSMIRFAFVILFCYVTSYYIALVLSKAVMNMTTVLPHLVQNNLAVLIGTGLYTIMNYSGQRYFVFHAKDKTAES